MLFIAGHQLKTVSRKCMPSRSSSVKTCFFNGYKTEIANVPPVNKQYIASCAFVRISI